MARGYGRVGDGRGEERRAVAWSEHATERERDKGIALRGCRGFAEDMLGRGRPHGKGAGLRPRGVKRSHAEELDDPTEKKIRPKLVSSDEPSTKLPRQASGGQSTRLTRASSALGLQLERADSFADLRKDESVVRARLAIAATLTLTSNSLVTRCR